MMGNLPNSGSNIYLHLFLVDERCRSDGNKVWSMGSL
jgi:hypothetical protein